MKYPLPKMEKGGQRYVLMETYQLARSIPGFGKIEFLGAGVKMLFGTLTIFLGFSWDGCSGGVTRQDKHNYLACLVHDALYRLIAYLMREGKITTRKEWEYLRKAADDELRFLMRNQGASRLRAYYYWLAVRWMGEDALLGNYRKAWKQVVDKVCFGKVCRFK